MAKRGNPNLIARAMQKRDPSRVALKKSACGAVMIDGLSFSISVESDGAASNKGVMFTISGDAVEDGRVRLDMIDVIYPSGGTVKSIKRKAEYYKKKDGKHIYRARFPEINIPQCADSSPFSSGALTEEQLLGSVNSQIIFKLIPQYSDGGEEEVMINIYPLDNPIDGSCTEWIPITADRDYFEHGGLAKISRK